MSLRVYFASAVSFGRIILLTLLVTGSDAHARGLLPC